MLGRKKRSTAAAETAERIKDIYVPIRHYDQIQMLLQLVEKYLPQDRLISRIRHLHNQRLGVENRNRVKQYLGSLWLGDRFRLTQADLVGVDADQGGSTVRNSIGSRNGETKAEEEVVDESIVRHDVNFYALRSILSVEFMRILFDEYQQVSDRANQAGQTQEGYRRPTYISEIMPGATDRTSNSNLTPNCYVYSRARNEVYELSSVLEGLRPNVANMDATEGDVRVILDELSGRDSMLDEIVFMAEDNGSVADIDKLRSHKIDAYLKYNDHVYELMQKILYMPVMEDIPGLFGGTQYLTELVEFINAVNDGNLSSQIACHKLRDMALYLSVLYNRFDIAKRLVKIYQLDSVTNLSPQLIDLLRERSDEQLNREMFSLSVADLARDSQEGDDSVVDISSYVHPLLYQMLLHNFEDVENTLDRSDDIELTRAERKEMLQLAVQNSSYKIAQYMLKEIKSAEDFPEYIDADAISRMQSLVGELSVLQSSDDDFSEKVNELNKAICCYSSLSEFPAMGFQSVSHDLRSQMVRLFDSLYRDPGCHTQARMLIKNIIKNDFIPGDLLTSKLCSLKSERDAEVARIKLELLTSGGISKLSGSTEDILDRMHPRIFQAIDGGEDNDVFIATMTSQVPMLMLAKTSAKDKSPLVYAISRRHFDTANAMLENDPYRESQEENARDLESLQQKIALACDSYADEVADTGFGMRHGQTRSDQVQALREMSERATSKKQVTQIALGFIQLFTRDGSRAIKDNSALQKLVRALTEHVLEQSDIERSDRMLTNFFRSRNCEKRMQVEAYQVGTVTVA